MAHRKFPPLGLNANRGGVVSRAPSVRNQAKGNAFGEFRPGFVPEGHPTIARRFDAGLSRQYRQVPEGLQRIQLLNLIFFRPSGTRWSLNRTTRR